MPITADYVQRERVSIPENFHNSCPVKMNSDEEAVKQ